jgi:hypothetical protein
MVQASGDIKKLDKNVWFLNGHIIQNPNHFTSSRFRPYSTSGQVRFLDVHSKKFLFV